MTDQRPELPRTLLAVALVGAIVSLAACSPNPATQIGSSALQGATGGTLETAPKRTTPVIGGRPARMFIWAGFDEKNCQPTSAKVVLTEAPAKGSVSFKPNQSTLIKQSSSGKCIGKRMPGTGIYYTARFGEVGHDKFSVTATTPSGQTSTRVFDVMVSE
ncbi:MAG: hypothetical protein K0U74_08345 [Alphaproteobacteria bacterium]|nr:hypothetical protein [Alphaproteobacteria bacterium]